MLTWLWLISNSTMQMFSPAAIGSQFPHGRLLVAVRLEELGTHSQGANMARVWKVACSTIPAIQPAARKVLTYKMCIYAIAVSCNNLDLGRVVAKRVADELGCRFIDEDVLIQHAADKGDPVGDLLKAIRSSTDFHNEFIERDRLCRSLLREGLFRDIQSGRTVCYGPVTSWLPLSDDFLHIEIRVQTEALPAVARKKLERTQAQSDEFGQTLPFYFTTVTETCQSIVSAARDFYRDCTGECEIGVRQVALASEVEAALILDPHTSRADLRVTANRSWITVSGTVKNDRMLHHARRVAEQVRGVMHVDTDGIAVRASHLNKAAVLAAIFVLAGSAFVGHGIWQHLRRIRSTQTQTLVGVITDTRCVRTHRQHHMTSNSECVRSCVESGDNVKYALDDGKSLFVLNDPGLAGKYAGRQVKITGVVDKAASTLTMQTIIGL